MEFLLAHPREQHVLHRRRYAPMQRFPVAAWSIRCGRPSGFAAPTTPIWLIPAPVLRIIPHWCVVMLIQTNGGRKDTHPAHPGKPLAVVLLASFLNAVYNH